VLITAIQSVPPPVQFTAISLTLNPHCVNKKVPRSPAKKAGGIRAFFRAIQLIS
jgi:hypothetical protein